MSRIRHIEALGIIAEQQAAQNLRLKALLRRAVQEISLLDKDGFFRERASQLVFDMNHELAKDVHE